jgi:ribosome-binding factor A
MHSSVREIKRKQKESVMLREIAKRFRHARHENDKLESLHVTRVQLSTNKSICTIFIYSEHGKEFFAQKEELLASYLPAFRKALAKSIYSRYVPELRLKYDAQLEKQIGVEEIFERLKRDEEL